MKQKAQVVIIGGGVIGLSVAHHLAKLGLTDVVVLEADYVLSGASGRNGGGVRMQWGTKDNILLAKESVKAFKKMSGELGINIWFRQGGYLFITEREDKLSSMKSSVALQNSLGVKSRMVAPEEAKRLVPVLNTQGIVGGTFCKEDGVLYPWPVIWGLRDAVVDSGIEYNDFTRVERIDVQGGKVKGVSTTGGNIECQVVVNAAGGHSDQVTQLAGLRAPNYPTKHNIIVTESLKRFLDPMVASLDTGIYFSQTMRGEIVGGLATREERTHDQSPDLEFLKEMARQLVRLVPRMGSAKVLRQWAGLYDMTPDENPILGGTSALEGFVFACGLCGHGFMVAPAVGRLVAEEIAGKKPRMPADWRYDRFRDEKTIANLNRKEAMALG